MDSIVSNVETKGSLCFGIYSSVQTEKLLPFWWCFIYHPPLTSYIQFRMFFVWFFLLFFSPGLLNFISTNHPSKLFPSRQADQHSAALVRQEGITVLSHFSPSARRHHYAVPNSNRARDTDGPGGVSLPKNISGRERRSS